MTAPVLAAMVCTICGRPARRRDPADDLNAWCSPECRTRDGWRHARARRRPSPRREPSRASCCGAWTTSLDHLCTLHRTEPPA